MTIALYARPKGWALAGVTVRLRHSRIHAEDCAECETKRGMLDRIEREIATSARCIGRSRRRSAFERRFFEDVDHRLDWTTTPPGHPSPGATREDHGRRGRHAPQSRQLFRIPHTNQRSTVPDNLS